MIAKSISRTASVGVALGLSISAVGAAPTSSTLFKNFTITVEDLDLSDGLEAGYTTSFLSQSGFASAHALPNWEADKQFYDNWSPMLAHAFSGENKAEVAGGENFLSTSGSGEYVAIGAREAGILVSPHTRLVFTADAEVSASIDSLACDELCQSAGARITILHSTYTSHHTDFALATEVRGPSGDLSRTLSAPVSFSIENTESVSAGINFRIHVESSASSTAPIPEPSTYALMLAGLGLCAAVARRRARPN